MKQIKRAHNRSRSNQKHKYKRIVKYKKHRRSILSSSQRHKDDRHHNKKRHRSSSSSSQSSQSSSSSSQQQSNLTSNSVSSSTAKRRRTPHFKFRTGEKIGHKYRLTKLLGDGTFGRVVEGRHESKCFAIKIIKPVEKYIQSAKTQRSIIKKINEMDYDDRFQFVRYVESFYHHQFYCMVFKPLGKSLYEIIKKNKYQGFPIKLVQSFFYQILKSINFMHQIGYTHTDLKPENILVETEDYNRVKHHKIDKYYLPSSDKIRIIDFGGATHTSEKHSSVINTRQYRSPEVILQCCNWNEISDVWSIGCIIPELYSGELFFDTHNDYEHLTMIEKNSGKFPTWMAKNVDDHTLRRIFYANTGEINEDEVNQNIDDWSNIVGFKKIKEVFSRYPELANLLNKCLQIDPKKRITCEEALSHEFFKIAYTLPSESQSKNHYSD